MSETLHDKTAVGRNLAGKYLTFGLGGESSGIDVLKVREIIRRTEITAVPPSNSPGPANSAALPGS